MEYNSVRISALRNKNFLNEAWKGKIYFFGWIIYAGKILGIIRSSFIFSAGCGNSN